MTRLLTILNRRIPLPFVGDALTNAIAALGPTRYWPLDDPSGTTADGAAFRDIREFRAALLEKPEQITRSLAEQLIAYATGAGISFADRREVARITAHVCGQSHGVRSLIHAVVQSPLFQNK